jgi:predicted ATP-grasp superfamily ATP-dependent carboligase
VKLLAQPSQFGVGLCFEEAPVDAKAAISITRLCQSVDYTGVFEAEFLHAADELQLIDVNPRFYGQMAFDEARGLPQARLAFAYAQDDTPGLMQLKTDLTMPRGQCPTAFSNRLALEFRLTAQRFSGRSVEPPTDHWRAWLRKTQPHRADAIHAETDPLPGIAATMTALMNWTVHPRSSYREAA